ncbi:hypothetical protein SLA2020_240090 [Shorea laevis]
MNRLLHDATGSLHTFNLHTFPDGIFLAFTKAAHLFKGLEIGHVAGTSFSKLAQMSGELLKKNSETWSEIFLIQNLLSCHRCRLSTIQLERKYMELEDYLECQDDM